MSTLSPLQADKGFGQPSRYRRIVLDGFNPAPFQWNLSRPEAQAVKKADRLVYEVRTTIQNQTGAPARIQAIADLSGDRVTQTLSFKKDARQVAVFDMPFKKPGKHLLRLSLSRADAQEVVLTESATALALAYQPVGIEIPGAEYRDCLFASQNLRTLRARVTCAGEYADKPLTLTLARVGMETKRWAYDKAGPERTVEIPMSDVPEGMCRFEARVAGLDPVARQITRLPHVAGEVWLDANGNPFVDGKPFIPFGWFSEILTPEQTPEMNAGQGYMTLAKRPLDTMLANGKKLIAYPYDRSSKLFQHEALKGPFTAEQEREIRKVVEPIKHHPALLGYYLVDEPEGGGLNPEWFKAAYALLRKIDPHHPVIVLNYGERGMQTYYEASDILMPDCYPVYLEGGRTRSPISNLAQWTRTARSLRPTWMVPQAFDWDSGNSKGRAPTFDELRNEVWSCFAEGSRGIFLYSYLYDGRPYSLSLRIGPPYLAREARALQAALYGKVVPDGLALKVTPADTPFVRTLLQFGDDLLLIAVNNTYEKRTAKFTLSLPVAGKKLYVVGEKRSISVVDGSFIEQFAPVETRLFTTRADLANAVDLPKFRETLAAAERARRKPGNLVGLGGLSKARFEEIAKTRPAGLPHVDCSSVYNIVYHAFRRSWLPIFLLDGLTEDVNQCNWSPTAKDKTPWIEVSLPKPGPVGRVKLYTANHKGKPRLRSGRVLLRLPDGSMKQVAEFSGNTKYEIEVRFAPELAKAVRLEPTDFTVTYGGLLSEFEVYEK